MTGQGAPSNHQSGLVNVNFQNLALAVPLSVAVPIGIAANVRGINAAILAIAAQNGNASCTAQNT